MNIVYIVLTSLGSILALFLLVKIMGNRQMSQLSMFDYINGITIGSIAAELATSSIKDFHGPLIAMISYAVVVVIISSITNKSILMRRLIVGKSLILLENGKLYEKNLKKSHMDLNEFLTQCRNSGYFDIMDLQTAILEPNGKISFLPLSTRRPANPDDFNLHPVLEKPLANVIMDGHIMEINLRLSGHNNAWLKKELSVHGISKIKDVFLATCDDKNKLNVYMKINRVMNKDYFD